MTKNIMIIGAGNLGSRHLQGLKSTPADTLIYIIDPAESSLALSLERWKELTPPQEARFFKKIPPGIDKIDLAIIACSADVRAQVTQELLQTVRTNAILFEKVLFQNLDDYDSIQSLLQKENVAAWVNCPRRLWN